MNIHVFIDAENMPPNPVLESYDFLKLDHNVYSCDVVGKWGSLLIYNDRKESGLHLQNSDYGKNSADLWITVLIAKAIYEEPELELVAIFSNDRDFAPIINLAVEKGKQVLLLVMESQYTGINNTLTRMKINRDFVTLGVLKDEHKLTKVKVSQLPVGLRSYYLGRYTDKNIFVKHGDQYIELPFINGMDLGQFTYLMRHYKIWTKNQRASDNIKELCLKIWNNRVWYQSEAEMLR